MDEDAKVVWLIATRTTKEKQKNSCSDELMI
jgi:hypothetical protein